MSREVPVRGIGNVFLYTSIYENDIIKKMYLENLNI
jgi:hypothetical protein